MHFSFEKSYILRVWLNILCNFYVTQAMFTPEHSLLQRFTPLLSPPTTWPASPPCPAASHPTRPATPPCQPPHPAFHPTLPASAACLPRQPCQPRQPRLHCKRCDALVQSLSSCNSCVCVVQVNVQPPPIFYTPHLIFYVPHLKFYIPPPKFYVPHLICPLQYYM